MHLRELLDVIDNDHDARLWLKAGKLQLRAPRHLAESPELVGVIANYRELLVFHVRGLDTGHAIGFCTDCGQPSMVHVGWKPGEYRKCRITPQCGGRHVPRERDVPQRSHHKRPKEPKPPPNPGRRVKRGR